MPLTSHHHGLSWKCSRNKTRESSDCFNILQTVAQECVLCVGPEKKEMCQFSLPTCLPNPITCLVYNIIMHLIF